MPASLSCHEFLDVVRTAGVVDDQALGTFLEQWRQTSPPSDDTGELAEHMFQAGLITSFQKGNLLQGKRRGYIIADKYILLEHIGAGGMGSVWLCQHKVMRRRVAIKVLPTNLAKDPEYLARFHRESRAAAALDHPNIVRAFDVDHDDKIHFLVMEYVDGRSLQDMIDDGEAVSIKQAADYISQAAAGLQHAHEAGLVHRDIKPGNLLVDRKGTIKILDMGLALFFQEQGKSLTQQYDADAVLGTAEYLAPEQVVNSHGVDIRADIYSLGLTFFFLLTGKSPYGEEGTVAQKLIWHQTRAPQSVRKLRPEVPEGLAEIIMRMLAKDRDQRYQTPDEVVKALAPWVQGAAEPAPLLPLFPLFPVAQKSEREPAPSEGQPAIDEGPERKVPPATRVNKGPETVRASEEETVVEVEEDSAKNEVPAKPPPKSDAHGPDSKRKVGKSDKNVEVPEDRLKSKKKETSGKRRRKKAATGFWDRTNLILAGTGVGVLVVLGLVVFFVVSFVRDRAAKTPATSPEAVTQIPNHEGDKNPLTPHPVPPDGRGGNGNPPPKEIQKNPEPIKKDGDASPPPPEKKKPRPRKRETPPNPAPPPETANKTPPPPEKKTAPPQDPRETLADYFPKPGATLFYNIANYSNKAVLRQKWEFAESGVINISVLQLGVLEKDTLLKNGPVKWLKPYQGKDQIFFRTTKTHIEMGQMVSQTKAVFWEPVLPLLAGAKDTWKLQMPNGDFKEFSVVKFDKYKGKPAVTIRDSISTPQGGKVVTHHTYVQGSGEVTKSQSLENMPAPPQLLMEAKLVEE